MNTIVLSREHRPKVSTMVPESSPPEESGVIVHKVDTLSELKRAAANMAKRVKHSITASILGGTSLLVATLLWDYIRCGIERVLEEEPTKRADKCGQMALYFTDNFSRMIMCALQESSSTNI